MSNSQSAKSGYGRPKGATWTGENTPRPSWIPAPPDEGTPEYEAGYAAYQETAPGVYVPVVLSESEQNAHREAGIAAGLAGMAGAAALAGIAIKHDSFIARIQSWSIDRREFNQRIAKYGIVAAIGIAAGFIKIGEAIAETCSWVNQYYECRSSTSCSQRVSLWAFQKLWCCHPVPPYPACAYNGQAQYVRLHCGC